MTKLLRVEAPSWCAAAEVNYTLGRAFWGRRAPYLARVIRNMTVSEFMQFLKGTGARIGWTYQWL